MKQILIGTAYCRCVLSHDTNKSVVLFLVCYDVQCIITPALAGSKIVIEAYKKYVLVSLLVDGKVALCVNAVRYENR